MLNFASLFNQWRTQNNNGVADLLSQSNINMGRLLDQESFQGQYKTGSPKVVEFMKYERYEELIEFITVVGPADDKKRSYKYPLSSCEVLCIDNSTALDYFLPEKPIILENKIEEQIEIETEVQVEESSSEKKEDEKNEPQEVKQPEQQKKKQAQEKVQPKEAAAQPKVNEQEPEVEILQEAPAEQVKPVEAEAEDASPNKPQKTQEAETPKKKMKKVLKKELKTIERIEQRQAPALIYKLLAYFDGEVNYTLAGYVAKVLAHFISKKPNELMKHLLQESVMHKIINHAQSRSIGELIVKILTHESTILLEQRRQFFKELLTRCTTTLDVSIISNISSYICEIIEKVATNLKSNSKINEFNTTFFSLDIITQVIKNVMSDEENVAVYNAPILLTYLTNVPFVLPEEQSAINQFTKLGEMFVEKSCEKLDTDKRSRPKLGFGRLKIIQILRFILKENVLNSKDIVAKTQKFFPILLKLVKEYEMNNMLHNEVMRIVQIALTEQQDSALNKSILRDDILFNFINEEWQQDRKIKAGDSVYKYRKGYIAHVINLCVKLREFSAKNQTIKKMIQSPGFTAIYQSFIEKEVFNSKKSLAGLMKKEQKHQILFQKEDIIAAHMTFLQKCPNPVYEPDPVQPQTSSQSPDLVQQLQKQLEQSMNIKPSDEKQKKASPSKPEEGKQQINQKESEDNDNESIQSEGKYWSTHLQFHDIDELMADL